MSESQQRELTVRAVLLGGALTFVFTAANVYFGLKVGLTFSTAIPAAVISMALLRQFSGSTIVENNIVQTIGSAAGAVATMIFILPALVIIGWWSGFPYWISMLTCLVGGLLGVLLSVPMRRALVIGSDLPYPEGVAGAEVLKVGMAGDEGARENRQGLITLIVGSVVAAFYGILTALKVAAEEIGIQFKLGSGVATAGSSLSLGLVGVGHLIGLTAGIAMGAGMILGSFVLLPWLSAGIPGPVEEVAGSVFKNGVRFVGAGTIAVAAVWTLIRISGSIFSGLAGIAATARARKAGEQVALTERDLPGWIVGGGSLLAAVPIGLLLWAFVSGTPLAGSFWAIFLLTVLFVAVVGVIVSAVTGYMAGLVGTSNSPVSGVGILSILVASLIVAALFGHGADVQERMALTALALFITAFVFGIGIVANDNLQDLKTGQLVGSTPWKQQVALVIGVAAGSLVVPPVLQLLLQTYNFAGAPGAGPDALGAPQASLIASIAQGVLTGDLPWRLLGTGAGIGVVVIAIDEALRKSGKGAFPPLAVAMGIYLPITLILPTVIGAVIGHLWNKMAARTRAPETVERAGVLLATGFIVGDSMFGLFNAGTAAGLGTGALAIMPESFAPAAGYVGLAVAVAVLVWSYQRTRKATLSALS